MSDHSTCEHANFPPCALNDFPHPDGEGNHGPAVGIQPITNGETGESSGIWMCGFCTQALAIATEAHPMIGAMVLNKIAAHRKSWSELEADTLNALGRAPGDVHLNDLLGGIHEAQQIIADRAKPASERISIEIIPSDDLAPMPVNEVAALFARTSTNFPDREEIN